MSFSQGAPTQPLSLVASNVFLTGSSTAGNAFTVQQLNNGNVISAVTSSGSTALIVTGGGNVGVGKTNPSYAMDINGDLNFSGTFRQNGTPYIGSQWTGTSTLYFVGNVGINTNNVSLPLSVNGTASITTLNLTNALGVAYGGTGVTTSTGSGSVVLSASPTLTGTVSAASISATGTVGINTSAGTYALNLYGTNAGTSSTTGAITNSGGSLNLNAGVNAVYVGVAGTYGYYFNATEFAPQAGTGSRNLGNSGNYFGTAYIQTLNLTNALGVSYGGTGTTTSTGTGSVVLSASPTLTGTLSAATISASASISAGTYLYAATYAQAGTYMYAPTIYARSDTNGAGGACIIQNLNAGSSAYCYAQWNTDTGSAYIFKNSSTRTNDGGVKTCTFRNDDGDLRLAAYNNSPYIYLQSSTGRVGINLTSPSYLLHCNSDIATNGWFRVENDGYGLYSDYRSHGICIDGASYGNVDTYGGGTNGWQGYSCSNNLTFMQSGNAGGIYSQATGWWTTYFDGNNTDIRYQNSAKGQAVSYGFACYGTLTSSSDIIAFYSDERLKNIEGPIDNALEKVSKLDGFYYTPNELGQKYGFDQITKFDLCERKVGVSAQKVQEILPEAVKRAPFDVTQPTGENYLTVQYEKLIPLLIEALKEERALRMELQDRLERLEKRL